MTDFQGIGQTAWEEMSVSEIRHFARGLSGSGVAADARAIGSAGNSHADSLAELQRDAGLLSARWRGEAKDQSYVEIGQYTDRAYTNAVALRRLVGDVEDLSDTATTTTEQFSDLPDPPSTDGAWSDSGYRNEVAEGVRSTYSAPVQTSASTLPLGESRGRTDFRHVGPAATKNNAAVTGTQTDPGSVSPTDGAGTGGGTSDTGNGTDPAVTGSDTVDTAATGTDTAADEVGAGTGTGAGPGSGTGAGTGTGTGDTGAGEGPGSGTDPTPDDPTYDPLDDTATQTSLLSPSTGVPVTSAARTGAGLSRIGGRGDVGRTASPLGLRQDAAIARSAAPQVGTGATTTGARPSTGPYGMPAAGAGAQRGQGDGRHRAPAYLIDRSNGEELVGGMPLVGPGVIGQWKSDGPPDAPRPPATSAAPPATGGPRPR
ncbi:hypothetical protein [Tsukamurella ocularis]|uniref:hypothetical protein n=1 Tax=Tsukamurella ocularis TaxID=1970234 RepID=UPI00216A84DD|nr:hypothetical protein [Tsukamurella ocularis]MCS3780539.1 hypothetical protein [Tsukamurella ocularis]MCS3849270.1 hypothetical protein [Tsukamurella ocularis]